jgi:hypothetical protein
MLFSGGIAHCSFLWPKIVLRLLIAPFNGKVTEIQCVFSYGFDGWSGEDGCRVNHLIIRPERFLANFPTFPPFAPFLHDFGRNGQLLVFWVVLVRSYRTMKVMNLDLFVTC